MSHSLIRRNPLHWRHNGHDGVSNHQPHGCLLNRLFRHRSKKTSKLHVTGLCVGNSPGPVNSPHKGPVTRKMFPFDDVIMRVCFKNVGASLNSTVIGCTHETKIFAEFTSFNESSLYRQLSERHGLQNYRHLDFLFRSLFRLTTRKG